MKGRATPIAEPRLSVVMPVYNEIDTVQEMIERVLAMGQQGMRIDLVVVDDCSRDGSRDASREGSRI